MSVFIILLTNSSNDVNGLFFLSSSIFCAKFLPTFFIAISPNLMFLSLTVKVSLLSFISGGKTLTPNFSASRIYSRTLTAESRTLVRSAAKYSAG